MTPEERRIKYIQYYQEKIDNKDHCCSGGQWYDNYALKELQIGRLRPPYMYDVCYCITGFKLANDQKD